MRVRRVTSLHAFDELALVWQETMKEAGLSSPFLSHDWFACCWRSAGRNRQREVWVLEDSGGPVAFIPLLQSKIKVRGLPVRRLELMNSPDTPFIDFPMTRGSDEVVRTFLETLAGRRDWDVCSLVKLPAHSTTLKALERMLPDRFPSRVAATTQSPSLDITGTWEDFLLSKSQRFRKTCRNIENRLGRDGRVALEEHRELSPDGPIFKELMEVSQQSWKAPHGLAMATMEGMPRFFRELTRRASANGWLHVWVLRLDGRAIGTEYQIGNCDTLYALRADFDSSLGEVSPGACLNLQMIRSLFRRQIAREYNMGPGPSEYKLRWATGASEAITLELFAPHAYGRFLHAIETRAVPLARRWRAWLGERYR